MYVVRHYLTRGGQDVYLDWLTHLRDNKAKAAAIRRVFCAELGNFGDHKFCQHGVWEMRLDFGPGYRIYYGIAGENIILLLCAGDKGSQSADIERACSFWKEWQARD